MNLFIIGLKQLLIVYPPQCGPMDFLLFLDRGSTFRQSTYYAWDSLNVDVELLFGGADDTIYHFFSFHENLEQDQHDWLLFNYPGESNIKICTLKIYYMLLNFFSLGLHQIRSILDFWKVEHGGVDGERRYPRSGRFSKSPKN